MPVAPVETRHVFEDLAPSLRETALKMCEGNPARIRVITSSRFEILTEAELAKEVAARTVRNAVTVHVEKESPAKRTQSRRPRAEKESEPKEEEAPAENASPAESTEAPKVKRRRKAKTV